MLFFNLSYMSTGIAMQSYVMLTSKVLIEMGMLSSTT